MSWTQAGWRSRASVSRSRLRLGAEIPLDHTAFDHLGPKPAAAVRHRPAARPTRRARSRAPGGGRSTPAPASPAAHRARRRSPPTMARRRRPRGSRWPPIARQAAWPAAPRRSGAPGVLGQHAAHVAGAAHQLMGLRELDHVIGRQQLDVRVEVAGALRGTQAVRRERAADPCSSAPIVHPSAGCRHLDPEARAGALDAFHAHGPPWASARCRTIARPSPLPPRGSCPSRLPCAAAVDLVEALEDACLVSGRDADAVVGDGEPDAARRAVPADAHLAAAGGCTSRALWARLSRAWPRRDGSARGAQCLADRPASAAARPRCGAAPPPADRSATSATSVPGSHGLEVQLRLARLDHGQVQQLVDQLRQVIDLALDLVREVARGLRIVDRATGQRLGQQLDRGERRSQLVADVGDEVPPYPLDPTQRGHVGQGASPGRHCRSGTASTANLRVPSGPAPPRRCRARPLAAASRATHRARPIRRPRSGSCRQRSALRSARPPPRPRRARCAAAGRSTRIRRRRRRGERAGPRRRRPRAHGVVTTRDASVAGANA